jgi:hypothetical protein
VLTGSLAKRSSPWHADIMGPKVGPSPMMRSKAELGTNEVSWACRKPPWACFLRRRLEHVNKHDLDRCSTIQNQGITRDIAIKVDSLAVCGDFAVHTPKSMLCKTCVSLTLTSVLKFPSGISFQGGQHHPGDMNGFLVLTSTDC